LQKTTEDKKILHIAHLENPQEVVFFSLQKTTEDKKILESMI